MNTLKPLLIMAIVSGIGYGVWNRLNRKPDSPPPGVAESWDAVPKVQLGDGTTNWSAGPPTAGGVTVLPSSAAPGSADTLAGAPSAGQPLAGAPPFGSAATPATNPGAIPPGDGANWRAGGAQSYDQNAAAIAAGGQPAPAGSFATVFESACHELEAGHLTEGLMRLSAWYDHPQLAPPEQQRLNELLDQVAGTVIYSTKDLLEPPYEVQPGDRLEDIGQRYNVPWQLLAKINGIEDPQSLRPGDRLKIVRGPFEAVVSLDRRQLTLFLNGAYAGRFAVGIGRDNPPREGQYTVTDKMVNPPYNDSPNHRIEPGDPANPLGNRWLGLGGGYGIHGTNDPNSLGRPDQAGCIGLGPRDVDDLFDILSVGSKITVRR